MYFHAKMKKFLPHRIRLLNKRKRKEFKMRFPDLMEQKVTWFSQHSICGVCCCFNIDGYSKFELKTLLRNVTKNNPKNNCLRFTLTSEGVTERSFLWINCTHSRLLQDKPH